MPAKKDAPSKLTYRQAGVDIDAGNALVHAIKPLAAATRRKGTLGHIGGFGALFDLKPLGYRDPVLVAATDGVGTKLKLAAVTGDHSGIGIDLVAMSVNDLIVQGAEPLFFLDYFACGKLDPRVAETVITGIAEGCRQAGCALIGGETAEMPGLYAAGDYDLAGFAVGAVERDRMLPRPDLAAGDVLIGLASSGIHSNGYSLVRKVIEKRKLALSAPAPFASEQSLGAALLTPTRIYVKPLLAALRKGHAIKALAHITGGGLTENLPRVLPKTLAAEIDLGAIPLLPVFDWLRDAARLDDAELLRTFNCGVGMVVVTDPAGAPKLLSALKRAGERPAIIGSLVKRSRGQPIRYSGTLRGPA